jgi:hypothetical protein
MLTRANRTLNALHPTFRLVVRIVMIAQERHPLADDRTMIAARCRPACRTREPRCRRLLAVPRHNSDRLAPCRTFALNFRWALSRCGRTRSTRRRRASTPPFRVPSMCGPLRSLPDACESESPTAGRARDRTRQECQTSSQCPQLRPAKAVHPQARWYVTLKLDPRLRWWNHCLRLWWRLQWPKLSSHQGQYWKW